MAICAVSSCDTSNGKSRRNNTENRECKYKLFRFPKDPKMAKIWQEKCGEGKNVNPRTAFICSKHFTKEHYVRNLQYELLNYFPKNARHLKEDAVPTEDLPFPNTKCEQDSEIDESAEKESPHTLEESFIKISTSSEYYSVEYLDGVETLEEIPAKDQYDYNKEIRLEDEDEQTEVLLRNELSECVNEVKAKDIKTNSNAEQELEEISAPREDSVQKWEGMTRKRKFKIRRESSDDLSKDGVPQELRPRAANELKVEDVILLPTDQTRVSEKTCDQIDAEFTEEKYQSDDASDENASLPTAATNADHEPSRARIKKSPARNYKALIESLKNPKPKSPEVKPLTAREIELHERIAKQDAEIKRLVTKNDSLNHQVLKLTYKNFVLQKELSAVDNIFSPSQRRKLRLGVRVLWEPDDIASSAEIYRLSPRAYKFLLKKGYPYPAAITIMKHLAKVKTGSKQKKVKPLMEASVEGQIEAQDQGGEKDLGGVILLKGESDKNFEGGVGRVEKPLKHEDSTNSK